MPYLKKAMTPVVRLTNSLIVDGSGFLNLDETISLGERKLKIQTSFIPIKIIFGGLG